MTKSMLMPIDPQQIPPQYLKVLERQRREDRLMLEKLPPGEDMFIRKFVQYEAWPNELLATHTLVMRLEELIVLRAFWSSHNGGLLYLTMEGIEDTCTKLTNQLLVSLRAQLTPDILPRIHSNLTGIIQKSLQEVIE